jgi:uncharacterized membrane protein YhiD involved in acid resistance
VVTGIGFLAGGVILPEGLTVKRMNTAATVWCAAGIGSLCGAGLLVPALAGTIGVLGFHLALKPISDRLDRRLRRSPTLETMYHLRVICADGGPGDRRPERCDAWANRGQHGHLLGATNRRRDRSLDGSLER